MLEQGQKGMGIPAIMHATGLILTDIERKPSFHGKSHNHKIITALISIFNII